MNEDGPVGAYLNIWSPVDGPAWEGLRGSFDGGAGSLGVDYEVLKFNSILSVSLSHACGSDVSAQTLF